MLTRRELLVRGSAAVGAAASLSVFRGDAAAAAAWVPASAYPLDVPAAWFDLALTLMRTTPGFSPPVASRAFGYTGVALYEAVVPGMPGRRSLAGRLNDLERGPQPEDVAYHWPTVANSALASILRSLFPTTAAANKAAVDALERTVSEAARAVLPLGVYDRSADRGAAVARHVFEWSKTDGGHQAYLNNFPAYTPPVGQGLWVRTPPGFQPALQPYWGANRTFVLASGAACAPAAPLPYAEDRRSAFYSEAAECYLTVKKLTPEQETIARYWSDDPGTTATPPGHSVSMTTQVGRMLGLTLDRAVEAYAKVGIAVADAFISCWHAKYVHNLLRPVTYINRLIDRDWLPILTTPPFPEYTSGHSVQSGAWAQVLTDLFGEVGFTDHTHDARGFAPRSFGSFMEAAQEAAISRLYGGIHFRRAIDVGVEQGICIGKEVSAL